MTSRPHKGWHSRGYLPHYDTPDKPQHVVFRVAGPLPKAVATCVDKQERIRILENWLDSGEGDSPLAQPDHANIVADSLRAFAGQRYDFHG